MRVAGETAEIHPQILSRSLAPQLDDMRVLVGEKRVVTHRLLPAAVTHPHELVCRVEMLEE